MMAYYGTRNASQARNAQTLLCCAMDAQNMQCPPPHALFVQGAGAGNGVLSSPYSPIFFTYALYFLHHILPYTLLLALTFTRIHQILA